MTQIGEIQFTIRLEDGTEKRLTAAEIVRLEDNGDLPDRYDVLDSRGKVILRKGGEV